MTQSDDDQKEFYLQSLNRALDKISTLRRERDEAWAALEKANEDLFWMSAASDFHPGGQAHEGWKKVRDRINARALLAGGKG